MRAQAWRGRSSSSSLAGPLLMAAGASLLGYWLYQKRTGGQGRPASGQRPPSGDDRIPDVGRLAYFGPLRPTGQPVASGQGQSQGQDREDNRTGRRYAAFSDPEKAPVEQGSCYGAVRHAGPENMRDQERRPWDKVDESVDESFPASDPPAASPGSN
ncbi:hypothetical protein SAE02_30610 [Skermanella aerolata]|uniref:Uncharacterized protein n=1 Tax=Skermanella aerolata TaxID=393310 RepID=A0A512DQY4_9PROT|nr:hypothetical protein [Skermanella aerolata]KJB95231.1 hypothetical protein N826_05080 [Skermanella aerolata KACC 11604]GEO38913.1 hypothetical protein SAE02_30610 [Skermanella aerolata]